MITAILKILGVALSLYERRVEGAPIREREKNHAKFAKALATGDTTTASKLLHDRLRKTRLRSKG